MKLSEILKYIEKNNIKISKNKNGSLVYKNKQDLINDILNNNNIKNI